MAQKKQVKSLIIFEGFQNKLDNFLKFLLLKDTYAGRVYTE